MGVVYTTEVTITKIGVNALGRLSIWTYEYESPYCLKRNNPNYNYIYETIKINHAYKIKYNHDLCAIQNELLDIEQVDIKTKSTYINNHCSLYHEFKWLRDYVEIIVTNSRKRFVVKKLHINQFVIGEKIQFNYIKLYGNLHEIQV